MAPLLEQLMDQHFSVRTVFRIMYGRVPNLCYARSIEVLISWVDKHHLGLLGTEKLNGRERLLNRIKVIG